VQEWGHKALGEVLKVLLFFLSSPQNYYPSQVQLYHIFARWHTQKKRPQLLLMFSSCHAAGKILPSQHKFSKALVSVALIKCLCWLCFCLGHCHWEMEMQDPLTALCLQTGSRSITSAERKIWGPNCGHGLNRCHCFSRGSGVCYCRNCKNSEDTQWSPKLFIGNLNHPGWSSSNPTTDFSISDFQSKSR